MNRNQKPKVLLPGANPEMVRADQERRRSNAAVRWDSRPKRQRARRDAKRAAIREHS